jgi:hypothetical protein
MQNGLSTRLCFLATCLVFASNVWASDLRPWGEGKDYVQLEAVSAVNQHPVHFSAEQLTRLLGQFYKRVGNKEPVPYFSQDEISRIAPRLVPLFAKSKPSEDLDFGTSFNDSGLFLIPRKLNAGRLFVENGQLNLIIGQCASEQDISYLQFYGKYRELDHGNRTKPVDKLGCELLAGNNTERVNNRADWLRLDINAALTTNAVPMFPSSSKTLTFGMTAPNPVASSAPVQAPSMDTNPTEAATRAIPVTPATESEERLMTLKHLHDKGLITDAEYEQKRAAVIKGL